MTITEQLQFSVLTAPVATLDRRTLSQAWYSALYGSGKAQTAAAKRLMPASRATATAPSLHAPAASQTREFPTHALQTNASRKFDRTDEAQLDRRAPRSPLARKIERAFLRPRRAEQKNAFTVEGEHGRVHVLLQSRGTQLRLVAICPPKARAQVAAALAQARYALALRGIDLDTDTRGAQQC